MRILRFRVHSDLPVEIFSFPEELQAGPGEGVRGKIEALGNVTFKTVGLTMRCTSRDYKLTSFGSPTAAL
jgi:hypothetical protein